MTDVPEPSAPSGDDATGRTVGGPAESTAPAPVQSTPVGTHDPTLAGPAPTGYANPAWSSAPPGADPGPGYPPPAGYPPPGYDAPPGYGPPPGSTVPPGYGWGGVPAGGGPPSTTESTGRRRGLGANATVAWVVAGVLAATVIGLSAALASTHSTPAGTAATPATTVPRPFGGSSAGGFGRFGSNGVVGTVGSVGSGSFTVTSRTGTTVTVDEQSSTVYSSGTASATPSAVVKGARVAVIGTRTGSTVKATRVIVLPAGGFGPGFFGGGTGSAGNT